MTAMRAMRITRRLSQLALARRVGVSQPTVSMWESGDRAIPPGRRAALASILGCGEADLDRDIGR